MEKKTYTLNITLINNQTHNQTTRTYNNITMHQAEELMHAALISNQETVIKTNMEPSPKTP